MRIQFRPFLGFVDLLEISDLAFWPYLSPLIYVKIIQVRATEPRAFAVALAKSDNQWYPLVARHNGRKLIVNLRGIQIMVWVPRQALTVELFSL